MDQHFNAHIDEHDDPNLYGVQYQHVYPDSHSEQYRYRHQHRDSNLNLDLDEYPDHNLHADDYEYVDSGDEYAHRYGDALAVVGVSESH